MKLAQRDLDMRWTIVNLAVSILVGFAAAVAECQKMPEDNVVNINFIRRDLAVGKLDDPTWERAEKVLVGTYWSGEPAPEGRHFEARLLWSETALYVRFDANQDEPFVLSENPVLGSKTLNLWDRDVCEIFIAPDRKKATRYFEFEVAPTGEWVDLGVEIKRGKRTTDPKYDSGMQTAAKLTFKKVTMAIRIPWTAFGKTPQPGEVWLGNIFRCVGKDPDRGYLAWQRTSTKSPNFHVPEKFGEFRFVGN